MHVNRVRASFEAVQNEKTRAFLIGPLDVIQDEIVSVGGLENLADQCHLPVRPHRSTPGRLEMRARQPPGGAK